MKISRAQSNKLNLTDSIYTARRGVSDPLASTVDCEFG